MIKLYERFAKFCGICFGIGVILMTIWSHYDYEEFWKKIPVKVNPEKTNELLLQLKELK